MSSGYIQTLLNTIAKTSPPESRSVKPKASDCAKSAIEVELRFLVDKRLKAPKQAVMLSQDDTIAYCKSIINEFNDMSQIKHTNANRNIMQISETMDFIQSDAQIDQIGPNQPQHIKKIKQLVFRNGIQQKDQLRLYTKQRLTSPIYIKGAHYVKLGISRETDVSNGDFSYDYCRIKLRISIRPDEKKYPGLKDWRIDLTLVKSIPGIISIPALKRIKTAFFVKDIEPSNFNEKAPWYLADMLEVEVEYVGVIEKLDESMLGKAIDSIDSFTNSNVEAPNKKFNLHDIAKMAQLTFSKQRTGLTIKTLLPQVIDCSKQIYREEIWPNISNFWLTDKADGIRSIAISDPKNGQLYIINDTEYIIEDIPSIADSQISIFDGEYVDISSIPTKKSPESIKKRFYAFDILVFNDQTVINEPFNKRLELLQKSSIEVKKFIKIEGAKQIQTFAEQLFNPTQKAKRPQYDIDGMIFIEDGKSYSSTRSYKWKPLAKKTIDFLAKKCPPALLDKYTGKDSAAVEKGKSLYFLFNGISQDQFNKLNITLLPEYSQLFPKMSFDTRYLPIQFAPSSYPQAYLFWSDDALDNQIVELGPKISQAGTPSEPFTWILHRIRKDRLGDVKTGRYYGNNYLVAESIWQSYSNPLTLEMLYSPQKMYFQEHESELHKIDRAFNRFVHSRLFEEQGIKNAEWVVDLANGKRQDLFRYANARVKNVLFIEKDKDAVDELIRRKHSLAKDPKYKGVHMSIYVQNIDLLDPAKNILEAIKTKIPIPASGVPIVFCGFALHYLVGTAKQASNTMALVKGLLAPQGRFIYTAFNGHAVFDLLAENNGRWIGYADPPTNSIIKYDIKRLYKSAKFTGTGQKIDVLLPFSANEYYHEYLINNKVLAKHFAESPNSDKKNIYESFARYFDLFGRKEQLTEVDKQYLSLYYYAVLFN